jgi:transposase
MVAAWELVDETPPETRALIGDKGYDSNELRAWLADEGLTPVIPRREIDGQRPAEHAELYQERNRIERAFNRLKDYRRFATRFDKLATTFEATVALIATRIWFLF